jgi:hypothetical protein
MFDEKKKKDEDTGFGVIILALVLALAIFGLCILPVFHWGLGLVLPMFGFAAPSLWQSIALLVVLSIIGSFFKKS